MDAHGAKGPRTTVLRPMLVILLVTILAAPAGADIQTFFLRHSDTPVAVPGGTTTAFLDALAPTSLTPLALEQIVPKDTSADFTTFTTPPFLADTPLLPIASIRLHPSANATMRGCASSRVEVFTVDPAGARTSIGSGARTEASIAQGSSRGTVGFAKHVIELAIDPTTVSAGHGLALATALGNDCGTNRRMFIAYDGGRARSRLRFQCCFATVAKCSAKKLGSLEKLGKCLTRRRVLSLTFGPWPLSFPPPHDPVDCREKLATNFADAERRKACPTTGDAAVLTARTDALTVALFAALDPLGPDRRNRCQRYKLDAAVNALACLGKAERAAIEKVEFLDPDPVKVERCRVKLQATFAKAEAKGGCDTSGDAAAILAQLDAFVTDASSRLACPCP